MLSLDSVSDGILFQCDGCRYVGEVQLEGMAEDGSAYCWKCLGRMKNESDRRKVRNKRMTETISQFEGGQCGRCGATHEPVSVFEDENGQKFCVTCWLGKESSGARRRVILIET